MYLLCRHFKTSLQAFLTKFVYENNLPRSRVFRPPLIVMIAAFVIVVSVVVALMSLVATTSSATNTPSTRPRISNAPYTAIASIRHWIRKIIWTWHWRKEWWVRVHPHAHVHAHPLASLRIVHRKWCSCARHHRCSNIF